MDSGDRDGRPRGSDATPIAQSDELDAADRRLLNEVQRDVRRSLAEIAKAAGLTPQTCHRRLQRLRTTGLILREAAIVDQRRSPWPLLAIVEVMMERLTNEGIAEFHRVLLAEPKVLQCYAVAGEADFLLIVAVEDMADHHRFIHDFLLDQPGVKHCKSKFSMRTVKFTTEIRF